MSMKSFRMIFAAVVMLVASACTDLGVEPKSTVTGANIFNDPASYRSFLAKLYAGLAVTGQSGPAGSGDIAGIDEGFSHYIRLYWQMQELPTDEAGIAWNDDGVQQLNTQLWSSSNQFLVAMYNRVYFQVGMANEFLRETSNSKLSERGASASLRAEIKTYRAEARFLRALSYWHGIDLFANIPLVTDAQDLGSTPPPRATRAQIFTFIENELLAIKGDLPLPKAGEYGRADQAAVMMLLAHLYLQAEVYTGANRYADALTQAQNVITSGAYTLAPNYRNNFLADNHTSPELIFVVPQDGLRQQSYGGTTFLAHASVGGSMSANAYGLNFGWGGLRLKPETYNRFAGADNRRSYFYTAGQTVAMSSLTNFNNGIAAPKYQNLTSTGAQGSHVEFVDTDYPMFRLADAYLIYAEAAVRGAGGTRAQALTYINELRQRAYGNASGNITDAQMTLDFILDERSRELLWEGFRRQDLIRFDRFTDHPTFVWAWKGGVAAGRPTESFRDLYPLPATELLTNPNLIQNPGY
jgi:hypothetical protein